MRVHERQTLLLDHLDAGLIAADIAEAQAERNSLVQLDPDHPTFRVKEYRARRNRIALIALEYKAGAPIPDAPYNLEEHGV